MVIFLNADGTAEKVTPEHVYQGSNNVTDITVIAPYSMSTAMQIGFILPNGLYWTSPEPETAPYAPMEFVGPTEENDNIGAWNFVLPISVTERVGEVQIAINALGTNGNTTSYLCKFTVEESVLPSLPLASPEPSVYDLIQQYLARLDGRTANVPNLVASIQKASGNSFTYTDNKGVVSAPIALGVVDYSPTIIGAASVIRIPSTAWQNLGSNFGVSIQPGQHQQLVAGVRVFDLLVDLKQYKSDGTWTQFNATYIITQTGEIAITTNTLPNYDVAVFVWNGKGLVDRTAREGISTEITRAKQAEATLQNNIDAETRRAQGAEQNLQDQIDEIEQSGVDLTAREAIAAETQRAESAEATLQSNIDAETQRAEAAEQGLQDQINDIDALIPSSTSEDNLLTNEAFVNSSINNMAAFYITSNAQGDAFPTRASLLNATAYYYGGQERTPTQNDYAIVLADESQPQGADGNYPTTRYSFQGTEWSFQYVVNNTSLTQAQVNAINSGITSELVEQIKPAPVTSVNGKTGSVVLSASDIGAYSATNRPPYATSTTRGEVRVNLNGTTLYIYTHD